MNPAIDINQLSLTPLHGISWDYDPDLEDSVAKEFPFDTSLGATYNQSQLLEILKIIEYNEIPISFRSYGNPNKNPHRLYMTSSLENEINEKLLFERVYHHPNGNSYSGILPENFEELK